MTTKIEWDCPVCETMAIDWGGNGCSCWLCTCNTTNPEWDNECSHCGRSVCTDCGETITYNDTTESWEGKHLDGCYMGRS